MFNIYPVDKKKRSVKDENFSRFTFVSNKICERERRKRIGREENNVEGGEIDDKKSEPLSIECIQWFRLESL